MEWNMKVDGFPIPAIHQFTIVLNERLAYMRDSGMIITKYAFTDTLANLLLCDSQPRDFGTHYSFEPSIDDFRETIPHPRGSGTLPVFNIGCRLEIPQKSDSSCGAIEQSLETLFSSEGRWYHSRVRNVYNEIVPLASTYTLLGDGQRYAFQIKWDTADYPPFDEPTQLSLRANSYVSENTTTIPVRLKYLLEKLEPGSLQFEFFQGILEASNSKGKGRAVIDSV
ncbi:hypothetical protein C8R46DRAFT_1077145 [Mycena filopes]|nr:hypothetical protein C8R46DRAFT_1077145 [Mycena filopes]